MSRLRLTAFKADNALSSTNPATKLANRSALGISIMTIGIHDHDKEETGFRRDSNL